MGEVNIKMHMGYRTFSARKKHGIAFYKAFDQVFRPGEILGDLGGMLKNIK